MPNSKAPCPQTFPEKGGGNTCAQQSGFAPKMTPQACAVNASFLAGHVDDRLWSPWEVGPVSQKQVTRGL